MPIEQVPSLIDFSTLQFVNFKESALEKTQGMTSSLIRDPATAIDIVFNGTLTTNGVYVSSEWNTHQLGFRFDNEEDQKALEGIYQVFSSFALEDWDEKHIIKDDCMWFKLKMDKSKNYTFSSNIKFNAKKPTETELTQGDKITIVATPNAYFNHSNKSYGIFFTVKRITV